MFNIIQYGIPILKNVRRDFEAYFLHFPREGFLNGVVSLKDTLDYNINYITNKERFYYEKGYFFISNSYCA